MTHILDTHTLVWYLEESKELGKKALKVLDDDDSKLIIPTIVLAEIKYLSSKTRISLSIDRTLKALQVDTRCIVYPLDSNVVGVIPTTLNIHDGIIVGTALVYKLLLKEEVKIVTKDKEITKLSAVKTVW